MVNTRKQTSKSGKSPEPTKKQKAQTAKGTTKAAPKPAPPKRTTRSKATKPAAKPPSPSPPPAPVKRTRAKTKTPAPKPKSKSPSPPPKEEKIVKAIRKGRAAVDSVCPKAKDHHVFEEGSKVWTSTLNQTNIGANANKFYIIQLLQHDSNKNSYYVWNRWGRVGYEGQNALKGPFGDLQRAKNEYQKKLNDKTKGGYFELEIVYDDGEEEEKAPKPTPKSKTPTPKESKLDKRIQNFIKLIFDINAINNTLAEIGYDSRKMPLGKLSVNNLKQGSAILKEIEEVLDKKKTGNLSQLSSRFYSLVPHDFGFQNVANFIINSRERLRQKIEMIDSLTDMKIASSILENKKSSEHPIDDYYKQLNCDLKAIEKSDPKYKLLEEYVRNTHAGTHNAYKLTVLDIFEVEREGEDKRFKKLGNNMLLWHGSRLTNWVGILSQGLRIAPPEAPVSGYMFGKGVYFADMVSKSANYCCTNRDNNVGVLLLCDVALGTPNEKLFSDYNAGNLPKGTHSTKGCGRNAPPESTYVDLDGCKVPLGEGKPTNSSGSLLYNEYIVYDVAQIKMKYLFKMRFDYKH